MLDGYLEYYLGIHRVPLVVEGLTCQEHFVASVNPLTLVLFFHILLVKYELSEVLYVLIESIKPMRYGTRELLPTC